MQKTDRPDDDEEGDISDDPFLSAANADLESVNKRNDNKLLVILLLLVPLVFLYEHSGITSIWLNAALIGLVVGSIAFTIFRVVRQKQKVAAKYGLVCPVCGYKPKAHMVLSTAMTLRCSKCGANLPG
jgi:formate dehydrogenase maturation protein FdhE